MIGGVLVRGVNTFASFQTVQDAVPAVFEFCLRGLELLEGGREVLELLCELVLYLIELGSW